MIARRTLEIKVLNVNTVIGLEIYALTIQGFWGSVTLKKLCRTSIVLSQSIWRHI